MWTPAIIQTYEYLPRLGPQPISVIQSTHDNYLPADVARVLFGPIRSAASSTRSRRATMASPTRGLSCDDAIQASLAWIDRLTSETQQHQ